MKSGGIAPSFLNSASDGGEWSASRTCRFTQAKQSAVPNLQEAGWATEPVWELWRRKISCPLTEIEPRLLGRTARSLVAILTVVDTMS
jgi:hypothetical protein